MAAKKKAQQKSHASRPANAGRLLMGGLAGLAILALVAWWWRDSGRKDLENFGTPPSADRSAFLTNGAIVPAQAEVFAQYAGSDSCRECHEEAFAHWTTSNHYFAERPMNAHWDQEVFDPPHELDHGTQRTKTQMTEGRYEVVSRASNGTVQVYAAQRVIGHDPLRQFLLEGPRGRWQAHETAWDPQHRELFNLFGEEDRQSGEWGHWTGQGMNWNSMCASCHNTRLRKNYDEKEDTYHTAFAEMSVGCEACHGPMKSHVAWHREYPGSSEAEPGRTKPDKNQIVAMCGTCHSRRYELTGDFVPGDAYFDHYALTIVDETEVYYADGQVREEDYVFASFLSSRMHAAGVTCLDCHQAHTTKTILPGNSLCMRCHSGGYPNSPIINPIAHSFHPVNSTGAQCVNCHMPQTTYMQRHPRRDHGFTIPDPLLTKELGIPNACNRCHEDRDSDWALAAVNEWYGDKMERPTRQRARWVAGARRGDDAVRSPLLECLQTETNFYWKAVAARLLERWVEDAEVRRSLIAAAGDAHPLVRQNALRSLGPLAESASYPEIGRLMQAGLKDSSRSVRYQAAWNWRRSLDMDSLAGRELQWALDLNADQPTGQMQKGVLALARDKPDLALTHYLRALSWDPRSAALRHELAVVYSLMNQPRKALEQMQEACRLSPEEAEYQYKLGLAWNEVGDLAQAVAAMEAAVELDPRHARAWYNLGLAQNQMGQVEAALVSLLRAESARPDDPGIPYARATVLAQAGRFEEARRAVQRALEVNPSYAPAQGLLQSLP